MSGSLAQWSVDHLIEKLEQAQLHGHGGAYFPTATKLRAIARQRHRPTIVVNASEGEPLSSKDRFLLSTRTNDVLDGALTVARALRADAVCVAVDARRGTVIDRARQVIGARAELNGRGLRTEVRAVPPGYVTGQETALIQALSGRDPKPTLTPPFPFERGLNGRPTLVSNAETFAQIGRLARGTYSRQRLVTVSGAVSGRTVVEVTRTTTVAEALTAAGGITEGLHGVLLGGFGGTWCVAPDAFAHTLDEPRLREVGLTLGAGILFALGQSACPVAETAHAVRWMAGQSAGQCGPCVFGLDAIASELESMTRTGHRDRGVARLERWSGMVRTRGACAHPDGVARFVISALSAFPGHFDDHARHGACEACHARRVLPAPAGGGFGITSSAPRAETRRAWEFAGAKA